MRPRMYGSSESQRFFTRISPSCGCGEGAFSRRKFSGVTQPSGRLASTMRWFSMAPSLRAGARVVQRRGPQDAQRFRRALDLGVQGNQRRAALLAELLPQGVSGARLGEAPADPGKTFLEARPVVHADHAKRPAQRFDLRGAPQVRERKGALVAVAGELERAIGEAPAPEVVELRGAELVAQQKTAVGPQGDRRRQAARAPRLTDVGRGQRAERCGFAHFWR